MSKEQVLIIISDSEGTSVYPEHSIHDALIDSGKVWTKGKRDTVNSDVKFRIVEKVTGKIRWCNVCQNHFTKNAEFVGNVCKNCHEKLNRKIN